MKPAEDSFMSIVHSISELPVWDSSLPPVAYLRRIDVLDSDLNVILRGIASDALVESSGESLDPGIAAEVDLIVRTHDFTRRPIATGLVGAEYTLRVVRDTGPAGSYYTVLSERTLLRRRLKRLAHRFRLTPPEAELMRLVAGGYPFAEMVRRLATSPTLVRTRLRELEEKAGCIGREELSSLALGRRLRPVSSPSLAEFPAVGSNKYRARRAGSRHR